MGKIEASSYIKREDQTIYVIRCPRCEWKEATSEKPANSPIFRKFLQHLMDEHATFISDIVLEKP